VFQLRRTAKAISTEPQHRHREGAEFSAGRIRAGHGFEVDRPMVLASSTIGRETAERFHVTM